MCGGNATSRNEAAIMSCFPAAAVRVVIAAGRTDGDREWHRHRQARRFAGAATKIAKATLPASGATVIAAPGGCEQPDRLGLQHWQAVASTAVSWNLG